MPSIFSSHSPIRIFAVSAIITLAALVWVAVSLGLSALVVVAILILIEITFSFDNAIINARTLTTMNRFWQQMFMTVGILIAVFGMRIVFPILVVMATAGLPWNEVLSLALNQPARYAQELTHAHASIASFGGMFLLMLALHFFFDSSKSVLWLKVIERPLQKAGRWWLGAVVCFVLLCLLLVLPLHGDKPTIFAAGLSGIVAYLIIHGLTELFERRHEKAEKRHGTPALRSGLAGLTAFLYLEVLDASFSFDGVLGAFAVTQDVVLIAIGLGIGALWIRSLTLFLVRRKVLHAYQYLEHGAHYTIAILALVLLAGLLYDVPEVVAGGVGIVVIALSVVSSLRENKKEIVTLG